MDGWSIGIENNYSNVIQAREFASLGNAFDFGDINNNLIGTGNLSSQIRALSYGGSDPSGNKPTQIDAVTIASSGNAFDFGDMSTYVNNTTNLASSTRGIMAGGTVSPTRTNAIQFVTINIW